MPESIKDKVIGLIQKYYDKSEVFERQYDEAKDGSKEETISLAKFCLSKEIIPDLESTLEPNPEFTLKPKHFERFSEYVQLFDFQLAREIMMKELSKEDAILLTAFFETALKIIKDVQEAKNGI